MSQLERIYRIDQLLQGGRAVPIRELLEELRVGRSTFKRDLEYMKERLYAPIEWDRGRRGYVLGAQQPGPKYELPGLWFSPTEATALLTMQQLIKTLQPGLLGAHLEPLRTRLNALLAYGDRSPREVEHRVRVIHLGSRRVDPRTFEVTANAVLTRKRLRITYFKRNRGVDSERVISPQRLVFYRDNWHVDSWCHMKKAPRSFALDAIRSVEMVDERAKDLPDTVLDAILKSGYGLHVGKPTRWAKLRFTNEAARWVALEEWHPRQKAAFQPDGSYLLEVPYNAERELLMDIRRYGDQVKVVAPLDLARAVAAGHRSAAALYA